MALEAVKQRQMAKLRAGKENEAPVQALVSCTGGKLPEAAVQPAGIRSPFSIRRSAGEQNGASSGLSGSLLRAAPPSPITTEQRSSKQSKVSLPQRTSSAAVIAEVSAPAPAGLLPFPSTAAPPPAAPVHPGPVFQSASQHASSPDNAATPSVSCSIFSARPSTVSSSSSLSSGTFLAQPAAQIATQMKMSHSSAPLQPPHAGSPLLAAHGGHPAQGTALAAAVNAQAVATAGLLLKRRAAALRKEQCLLRKESESMLKGSIGAIATLQQQVLQVVQQLSISTAAGERG